MRRHAVMKAIVGDAEINTLSSRRGRYPAARDGTVHSIRGQIRIEIRDGGGPELQLAQDKVVQLAPHAPAATSPGSVCSARAAIAVSRDRSPRPPDERSPQIVSWVIPSKSLCQCPSRATQHFTRPFVRGRHGGDGADHNEAVIP